MPVLLLGFLNRLPGVSFEEFDARWTHYGTLVTNLTAIKQGTVTYRQLHKDPHLSEQLAGTSGNKGRIIADFDGVAEWGGQSLEEIMEVLASDEFKETCVPFESQFFDRQRMTVMTVSQVLSEFKA